MDGEDLGFMLDHIVPEITKLNNSVKGKEKYGFSQ